MSCEASTCPPPISFTSSMEVGDKLGCGFQSGSSGKVEDVAGAWPSHFALEQTWMVGLEWLFQLCNSFK